MITAVIRVEQMLPAVVSVQAFGHARVVIRGLHLGSALQEAHARCAREGWRPEVQDAHEVCGGALHQLLRESRAEFQAWAVDVKPWPGEGIRVGKCPACGTTIAEPEPSALIRAVSS
jgi:hypothetical protein